MSTLRQTLLTLAILLGLIFPRTLAAQSPRTQSPPTRNIFHVKYVSEEALYLDGGRNAGLEEGMVLHLVHADPNGGTTDAVRFQGQAPIADVRISSLADSSCVAEVMNSGEILVAGDIAYLDVKSIHLREDKKNAIEAEDYPVLVTFSYGDPLDEEIRATTIPSKLAPTDNQMRGRIGFDLGTLSQPGGPSSRQVGLMLQADMSRIGGTYWNFSGYWRGRLNSQNTGSTSGLAPTTINDLINRTYHMGLYYQNPESSITLGVGRLYLPWASSLSTIDGGYAGLKITPSVTVGAFGGSLPDPTSWSYTQNQHVAGTFVNYERGNFDQMRFSGTAGLAITSQNWHVAREFAFFEDNFSLGKTFSIYNSLQADHARTTPSSQQFPNGRQYNTGLTQSFTSVRFQPITLITFSINHNYLRNLPTFDPRLISAGLVDQYLFQGLSGGVRLEFPFRIALSTDIGRSKNDTDKAPSWNQMYGLTFGQIPRTGVQLDLRYTKFNSSFGMGTYELVSASRKLSDRLHLQLQGGMQHLNSSFSTNSSSKFVTGSADWSFGPRYFFEALYSWNSGTTESYRQMNLTFGYRFGGFFRK